MNLKFVLLVFLIVSSCTTNKINPLISVDKKNSIFDLNKNGYLDLNESDFYVYYKKSDYITNEVIDTDHDGHNSAQEKKLVIDFLQSQPEGERNETLQKLLRIPGISIERLKDLGKVKFQLKEQK